MLINLEGALLERHNILDRYTEPRMSFFDGEVIATC